MNPNQIRVNERIRAREVRVINSQNDQQMGIMAIKEAIALARSLGLDLVEVAPNANPPVCRIVNYGKFLYDLAKQDKDRKNTGTGKVKEIKFRVNIDNHDYLTKAKHAEEFLDKGHKLKIHLQFRGREMAHKELGIALLNRLKQDLVTMAQVDMEPRLVGRAAIMTMSPLPVGKRKKKFTLKEEELEEEPGELQEEKAES